MAFHPAEFETMMRTVGLLDTDQLGMLNQEIIRQLKITRRIQGQQIKSQLQVGDKVQLPMNSKPQYLRGQKGRVEAIKDSRAHMRLDNGPMGKFRSGIVVVPFTMLTIIED